MGSQEAELKGSGRVEKGSQLLRNSSQNNY